MIEARKVFEKEIEDKQIAIAQIRNEIEDLNTFVE